MVTPHLTQNDVAGSDFSGVVEAAGRDADLAAGVAVFGGIAPNTGACAEYLVFKSAGLGVKPDVISFEEAACLPVAGLTAWAAVTDNIALNSGDRVLIQGAAGGVGHYAVQMAKRLGAYVIGTASATDLAFVRSLGADEAIDYRTPRFEDGLKNLSLVIDGVSSASMSRVYPAMDAGGVLVTLFDDPPSPPEGISAVPVRTRYSRETLEQLASLVARGALRVAVSNVYSLAEIGLAQEGSRRGKVVIQPRVRRHARSLQSARSRSRRCTAYDTNSP